LLETYWSEVERCFKVVNPASASARFVKPGAVAEPAQGSDGDATAEQDKAPEPTTMH
jgi:hypothetical protein